MEGDDDVPRRRGWLAGDEVEGTRKTLAESGAKSRQCPLQEGHVRHAAGEGDQLSDWAEPGSHEDGLEAIGRPADADGAILLEHRPMVGDTCLPDGRGPGTGGRRAGWP